MLITWSNQWGWSYSYHEQYQLIIEITMATTESNSNGGAVMYTMHTDQSMKYSADHEI